jgi:hypothetical protein
LVDFLYPTKSDEALAYNPRLTLFCYRNPSNFRDDIVRINSTERSDDVLLTTVPSSNGVTLFCNEAHHQLRITRAQMLAGYDSTYLRYYFGSSAEAQNATLPATFDGPVTVIFDPYATAIWGHCFQPEVTRVPQAAPTTAAVSSSPTSSDEFGLSVALVVSGGANCVGVIGLCVYFALAPVRSKRSEPASDPNSLLVQEPPSTPMAATSPGPTAGDRMID